MSEYKNWTYAQDGHIAWLTLNRPESQNNLTTDTLLELRDISERLSSQGKVWSVILQAAGDHFSTGMDTQIFRQSLEWTEQSITEMIAAQQECLNTFEALPKPTIARIHGFCIGGGLMLALCCDFRVASRRTIFSLPEIKLGIPILWGTHRVVRLLGESRAKELVFLGKRLRAVEALAYGLIHKVVNPEDLDEAVESLAERFAHLPPRTVGIAKRIIRMSHDLNGEESQTFEREALTDLKDSADLEEAIESYVQKRKPRFTGA